MRRQSFFTKGVAAATIVALQLLLVVPAQPASASLQGHVLSPDDVPLAGARVHVGDLQGERFWASGWTGDDGSFEVSDLPPAQYRVAIEADGGLYMVDAPVALAPGQSRSLQLSVQPNAMEEQDPQRKKKRGAGIWSNPLTATLIVLGSAIALGALIDNIDGGGGGDTGTASPSAP